MDSLLALVVAIVGNVVAWLSTVERYPDRFSRYLIVMGAIMVAAVIFR